MIEKYVGCIIEIIYLDTHNKITYRRVKVRSIRNGKVTAFCLNRKAPRSFIINNILAIVPVHLEVRSCG